MKKVLASLSLLVPMLMFGLLPYRPEEMRECLKNIPQRDFTDTKQQQGDRVYQVWCGGAL